MNRLLYRRLTPVERAELYKRAKERRDAQEVELLLATCPRIKGHIFDPVFIKATADLDLLGVVDEIRCPECEARMNEIFEDFNEQDDFVKDVFHKLAILSVRYVGRSGDAKRSFMTRLDEAAQFMEADRS